MAPEHKPWFHRICSADVHPGFADWGDLLLEGHSYAAIMQNLTQIVRGKLPWNSWIQHSTGGYWGERLRTEIDKETSLEFGFQ